MQRNKEKNVSKDVYVEVGFQIQKFCEQLEMKEKKIVH